MTTEIIEPEFARALLNNRQFISGWSKLWSVSASATRYQSPEFAVTWYEGYAERFEPVLVVARDQSGGLVGLLPLAWSSKENVVGAAGLWQSEYQGWIAEPGFLDRFGDCALSLVARRFPTSTIRFRYCLTQPPQALRSGHLRGRCRIIPRHRPIVRLDPDEVSQSFRKNGNKNRLRQMRKIGPIEFRRITDPAELERIFDNVVAQHDARRLACNGRMPFALDPRKKSLYLSLMRVPNLLHVTVLTVGGRLASVQLNIRESDHVQLHLITHAAEFARFSPGKLHIMFLARMLAGEGCKYLDLTPGDETFKKRFADESTGIHELTIHPTRLARAAATVRDFARTLAKRTLQRIGVRPALAQLAVKNLVRRALKFEFKFPLTSMVRWVWREDPIHVFSVPNSLIGAISGDQLIRCNAVEDLMAYRPPPRGVPLHSFVTSAWTQIELGDRIYTRVVDSRLESMTRASLLPLSCLSTGGCVLIEEFSMLSEAAGVESARTFLQSIIRDIAGPEKSDRLYLAIRSSCQPILNLTASMQLVHEYSVRDGRLLGMQRRRVVRVMNIQVQTSPSQERINDDATALQEAL